MEGSLSHLRVRPSRTSTRHASAHSEDSASEDGQDGDHTAKQNIWAPSLGGLDSILLRQRIMALVRLLPPPSPACENHSAHFPSSQKSLNSTPPP